MHKLLRNKLLGAMAVATCLAIGAFAVWMFVVGIVEMITMSNFLNESIDVRRNGQVFIVQRHNEGGQIHITYRTLDGQETEPGRIRSASFVNLVGPLQRESTALDWNQRIGGVSTNQRDPEYWFLIRDEIVPGLAYYEIFDSRSRRSIGFFGAHGFRPDRPPADDQLRVPYAGSADAFSSYYVRSQLTSTTTTYLISDGKLLAIDLVEREIRILPTDGEPIAVATMAENRDSDDETYDLRIAVRTQDTIIVMTSSGEVLRTVTIPEEIRDRLVTAYNIAGESPTTVVLTSYPHNRYWDQDVYRFVASVAEVTHTVVRLNGGARDDDTVWLGSLMAPSPAALAIFYALSAETEVELRQAASVPEALARSLGDSIPLALVAAISAALAVVAYRRQQRYGGQNAAVWAAFVLVLGLPGAVGYWLHRTWPVTERCGACGTQTPRDRDACLACDVAFRVPEPGGIEVLA